MAFVSTLPDNNCSKVMDGAETLYNCNGQLYRSTFYKDEKVYEAVSDAPNAASAEPTNVIGLALTKPMTRGAVVRDMQQRLYDFGYDGGGIDGVFGSGTSTALMWFQYDNGLDATGIVDVETAALLGYESPVGAPVPNLPATAPQIERDTEVPSAQEAAPEGMPGAASE